MSLIDHAKLFYKTVSNYFVKFFYGCPKLTDTNSSSNFISYFYKNYRFSSAQLTIISLLVAITSLYCFYKYYMRRTINKYTEDLLFKVNNMPLNPNTIFELIYISETISRKIEEYLPRLIKERVNTRYEKFSENFRRFEQQQKQMQKGSLFNKIIRVFHGLLSAALDLLKGRTRSMRKNDSSSNSNEQEQQQLVLSEEQQKLLTNALEQLADIPGLLDQIQQQQEQRDLAVKQQQRVAEIGKQKEKSLINENQQQNLKPASLNIQTAVASNPNNQLDQKTIVKDIISPIDESGQSANSEQLNNGALQGNPNSNQQIEDLNQQQNVQPASSNIQTEGALNTNNQSDQTNTGALQGNSNSNQKQQLLELESTNMPTQVPLHDLSNQHTKDTASIYFTPEQTLAGCLSYLSKNI